MGAAYWPGSSSNRLSRRDAPDESTDPPRPRPDPGESRAAPSDPRQSRGRNGAGSWPSSVPRRYGTRSSVAPRPDRRCSPARSRGRSREPLVLPVLVPGREPFGRRLQVVPQGFRPEPAHSRRVDAVDGDLEPGGYPMSGAERPRWRAVGIPVRTDRPLLGGPPQPRGPRSGGALREHGRIRRWGAEAPVGPPHGARPRTPKPGATAGRPPAGRGERPGPRHRPAPPPSAG